MTKDFREYIKRTTGQKSFIRKPIMTEIEGLEISIQASSFHRCLPNAAYDLTHFIDFETDDLLGILPIEEYTHMEVAFFKDEQMINLKKLLKIVPSLKELHLERFDGDPVFNFVPIEVIQSICDVVGLIKK